MWGKRFFKGLAVLKRNNNMPLIIFLSISLFIYLVGYAIRHTTIYIVFRSGVGPLFLIAFIILIIVVLYLKGPRGKL